MKIVQIGIGDPKITEVLSDLKVLSAVLISNGKNVDKKFPTKYYDSFDSLTRSEEFDGAVVDIQYPDCLPIVRQLLENKKHVFILKSIYDSIECKKFEEISRKNKVKLVFGFKQRFNPVIETLKNFTNNNRYGQLALLEFYEEGVSSNNNGIIFEKAIHLIDSANMIYGEWPIVIFARLNNLNNDTENLSIIMMGYKDNKTAVILSNGLGSNNKSTARTIYSNGEIFSDLISGEMKKNGDLECFTPEDLTLKQLQNFIKIIPEKNEINENQNELSNTIKIAEAALLSGKQGVPIYLDLK